MPDNNERLTMSVPEAGKKYFDGHLAIARATCRGGLHRVPLWACADLCGLVERMQDLLLERHRGAVQCARLLAGCCPRFFS